MLVSLFRSWFSENGQVCTITMALCLEPSTLQCGCSVYIIQHITWHRNIFFPQDLFFLFLTNSTRVTWKYCLSSIAVLYRCLSLFSHVLMTTQQILGPKSKVSFICFARITIVTYHATLYPGFECSWSVTGHYIIRFSLLQLNRKFPVDCGRLKSALENF